MSELEEQKNAAQKLSPDIRSQVDAHLFKWFAAIGIVNIAALVVGLAYIFFVIPEKAVSEAKFLIENQAQSTIAELQQTLMRIASEALVKSGEAKGISTGPMNEAMETTRALASLKNRRRC